MKLYNTIDIEDNVRARLSEGATTRDDLLDHLTQVLRTGINEARSIIVHLIDTKAIRATKERAAFGRSVVYLSVRPT